MDPQTVIQGLIARGMPAHIAQGFAGNFAVESGFNPAINEAVPLVPGSRGGFGLAQWTGPRRRELESWAQTQGRPLADVDTQLDFLMTELTGSENRAWQAIQGAQTPDEAARLVSERFLRPGIPHLDRRVNSALQFAGMEPQMLPPTVSSQSQQPQQQGGLFSGIRNFFGGSQPDPNAGSPTDPFANLSRAQRTMLGFAALRDAAASLEGRDSNFFANAMGGFEQARERERLRAQGQMQNRVAALEALGTINQQIAFNQSLGAAPDPAILQLREALMAEAGFGGAAPSGGMAAPAGGMTAPMGGGAPAQPAGGRPAVTPATGVMIDPVTGAETPYNGEPEVVPAGGPAPAAPAPAAPAVDPMADLDAQEAEIYAQMRQRMAVGAPTRDLEIRLDRLEAERQGVAEEAQITGQRQEAAVSGAPQTANVLETVQDLRDLIQENPRRTTGLMGSILGNMPGSAAFDARATRDTIGANLAFAELAAMRAASPTGGALGSITERELDLLQSTVANLNLDQSPEAVLAALEDVETRYQNMLRRAYETSEDPAALDRALGGRPTFVSGDDGATSPAASGGDIPQITSDAEYEALPSGAQFMAPDGTIRRKP